MGTTDNQLMEAVAAGDLGQLSVLFERHHRALFGFFVRLTSDRSLAEDLTQEVFFRLLKYRHSFQAGGSFSAWLYQVARNTHTDHLRKRKPEVGMPEDREGEVIEFPSPEPAAEDRLLRLQDVALLERALAKLPLAKREILLMARYQGLKYEDIAKAAGCEVNTVKVRVHRALKELSRQFHQLAGERAS